MSSITINGDTSGSVILQAPSIAGSTTLTLPSTSGTVLTSANTFANSGGPAFSAYLSTNQSITTSTWTKMQCNTEEFDTNSNYDNATNYRFTPTVAGYYQITIGMQPNGTVSVMGIALYKNGSVFKSGNNTPTNGNILNSSWLVYANGSSDYFEAYVYQNGSSPAITGAVNLSYFQAAMVRGA